MSSNNSRWEQWAAISVNASSAVTEARTITSQTGKFNESRGATGISNVGDGVWIVRLRTGQLLSGGDCYAVCTPRHTQFTSATALSGAVTCAVTHDSATAKRVTIIVSKRMASGAGTSYAIPNRQSIPFDLCLYRRTE